MSWIVAYLTDSASLKRRLWVSTAGRRLRWQSQRARCPMGTTEQDVLGHVMKRGEDLCRTPRATSRSVASSAPL